MNKPTYSIDKFLEKVSALPVVRQMVNEEIERNNAEVLKARMDCINRVQALEIEQRKARANVDSAEASLKAAEEKLTPYKIRLNAASQLLSEVNGRGQAAGQELQLTHGEGCVSRMFLLLTHLHDHCKTQISRLIEDLNPHYFVEGRLSFRPVHPSIKPALENQKLRLQAIEQAFSTAGLLVHANMTPIELKTQTDALLAAVGYRPNAVESFNDEPVL